MRVNKIKVEEFPIFFIVAMFFIVMSDDLNVKDKNPEEEPSFFKRITNLSDWDKKTWVFVGIFVAILLITVYLFYRMFKEETFLFGLIVQWVIEPISNMETWGWIIFIIFMGVQGIFAPIPSEIVLIAAGMIWPSYIGFILGVIGSMLAGWLCFYLSKKGGRPIVEKAIGKKNIETLDIYIEKYGAPVIFLARAFPFLAFDPISYVSGIVNIDTKKYLWATFFGSLIRVTFYTWLGSGLVGGQSVTDLTQEEIDILISENASTFNNYMYIIIGVLALAFLLYNYVLMPYLHKKSKILKNKESTEKFAAETINKAESYTEPTIKNKNINEIEKE